MAKIKFEDGIAVEASYLNEATDRLEAQINDKFIDTHTAGVVLSKSPETIVYTDGVSLGICGVTAYDSYGNRIYIPESYIDQEGNRVPRISGLLPDSDGKLIQGGSALSPNTAYVLVIRYMKIAGAPIAHKAIDGNPVLLGENDAYALYLRPIGDNIDGDVVLANVSTDMDAQITVDESVHDISKVSQDSVIANISVNNTTSVSDYGENVSFEDHINSVGTGVISKQNPHGLSASDLGIDLSATADHQKLLHVSGIRTNNTYSTVSAMYPSYRKEGASNSESIFIQPLSAGENEILVINGASIFPSDFPTEYSFSFNELASSENIGYYLFYFNGITKAIEHVGPFVSEQVDDFTNILNTPDFFPVCSFKWDLVYYDLTNDGISDTSSYDIVPATFKDRRVFNNTSLKTIRPDESFALTQFAPVVNDSAYIHNVCLLNSKTETKYYVAGKTLSITVDGSSSPISVVFTGANPLPLDEIVRQIQANMYNTETGELLAYARIVNEVPTTSEDFGKLSISAPSSLYIAPTSAAIDLGFDTATNNIEATSDGLIQEMIYMGKRDSYGRNIGRDGIIIFKYNSSSLITQIYYFLGGGKVRRNVFHYSGDYITRVDEIVEAL